MAFTAINSDQKVNLNLSEDAWLVVRQDMAAFGCRTNSGFFNRVILNYYEYADATLSRAWQRKFEEYCSDFSESPEDPQAQKDFRASLKKLSMDQRETAAGILADNAVQKLKETVIDRYPKGPAEKFRINNELFRHLTQSSDCQEDKAYGDHIGRYLKAVVEEYARLPYHRRERIFYAPLFMNIENAIAAKKRLKITTAVGTEYEIKPYRIMTDSQSTYHYLVAWNTKTQNPWPFRVSGIQNLKQVNTGSGKITEKERREIEDALEQKDVPFMGEEIHTIRVRLTQAGIRKYNTMLHMRPRYEEVKEDVYVFRTTLRQVQYYFEKFGPDARILEPEILAHRLRQWHQAAASQYE